MIVHLFGDLEVDYRNLGKDYRRSPMRRPYPRTTIPTPVAE